MKLALFALAGASMVSAGAAEAHQADARYNAASGYSRGYVTQGPYTSAYNQSRAQTWYSDTGWQPGTSAVDAYGYGYGYGGAGIQPRVILAAPYPGPVYSQPVYQVQRSQPFGYVVDGYGRYPWSRTAHYGQAYRGGYDTGCNCGQAQAHAHGPTPQPVYYSAAPVHVSQPPIYVQSPPVHVEAAQVHVAPPTVEVAAPRIHYDQGYFAVPADTPPPPPPSSTERPYLQEPGERG